MTASPLATVAAAVLRMAACTALIFASADAAVSAADFRRFDPATFSGEMLSATQLRAMTADAMKKTRPKDGKAYVFGFANLQRNIAFGILTEEGIEANAAAAGIRLVIADNRLDGPAAEANARSFVRQNVDFVIEFQTNETFAVADSALRAARQEILQYVESAFQSVPFDSEAARAYGRIYAAVREAGQKPRVGRAVDFFMAATALSRGLALLTRNSIDFTAVADLVEIVSV
jgi:predicted nucleic acid-binding protein